ncbi:hypothetical protein [Cupriavidus sp. a3]|uniref:hypothetical protein n=1 Tax=Cupriavidus sp. a3 TaxID=3242158 RepID=UPI003D9C4C06
MAMFIVRLVLQDADWDDYTDVLHPAMEKQGFSKTITSDGGKTYKLPDAEYYINVDLTRQQVRERAVAAAGVTKVKFRVLVTEAAGISWHNLEPATK